LNIGVSYRNHRVRYSGNSASYTFFRGRRSRPKIEISSAHNGGWIGFQVIVRRNGINNPYVECNGIEYSFEKQNHDGENVLLRFNTCYFVYPFAIQQDRSKGAYIVQLNRKKLREVNKYDTAIQASIRITGDGFEMKKDYVLTTNLPDLRTNRLTQDELIRPEDVTITQLQEINEPSRWRKFLSSFSVTRTRIPK
jgi:hypothetical protein